MIQSLQWTGSKHRRAPNNIFLKTIYEDISGLIEVFEEVSFQHVYRDQNCQADQLSKQGVLLEEDSHKL